MQLFLSQQAQDMLEEAHALRRDAYCIGCPTARRTRDHCILTGTGAGRHVIITSGQNGYWIDNPLAFDY